MGLHTWFFKERDAFDKMQALYARLDRAENGEEYLDDLEYWNIDSQASDLHHSNEAEFHDVFRTNKRNADGTYTDDVIYSLKECKEWLEVNKALVGDVDWERLYRFWEQYPNGVIQFG